MSKNIETLRNKSFYVKNNINFTNCISLSKYMYVQIVEKPFEKQSFRPLKLALKRKQEENSRALVP